MQKPKRSQVEHAVHPLHGRIQNIGVEDVPADRADPDARVSERLREIVVGAPRKVVEYGDLGDIFTEELLGDVRADEPGSSNDEDLLACEVH